MGGIKIKKKKEDVEFIQVKAQLNARWK